MFFLLIIRWKTAPFEVFLHKIGSWNDREISLLVSESLLAVCAACSFADAASLAAGAGNRAARPSAGKRRKQK
jgi:hypothetical protein